MADYDRAVRKLLRSAGGKEKRRGKGSHVIWSILTADGHSVSVSVPRSIKSKITANAILKQAGIDEKL